MSNKIRVNKINNLNDSILSNYDNIFPDEHDAHAAKMAFLEVYEHLELRDMVSPIRLRMADRYARMRAEYERFYPEATSEGPVDMGPNGGQIYNLKWSVLEKLNDKMLKLEEAFRITPGSLAVGTPADGSKGKSKKAKAQAEAPSKAYFAARPN